jgi:DNA-binding protein YbaB
MFDKVKQGKNILKLRSQAKQLQNELREIKHSEESGDYKITVNGAQEIVNIEINGERNEDLIKLINKAMKGIQKKAAKKMMEMGGGLGGLFGN